LGVLINVYLKFLFKLKTTSNPESVTSFPPYPHPENKVQTLDSTFPVEMAVETQLPARSADKFSICGTKNNQTSKEAATNTNEIFLSIKLSYNSCKLPSSPPSSDPSYQAI
jgi:hypothetical protein